MHVSFSSQSRSTFSVALVFRRIRKGIRHLLLGGAIGGGLLACVTPAHAQDATTCRYAVAQLEEYAIQVNVVAATEYASIASYCGWNQSCAQAFLYELSAWYQEQDALVNHWYQQILQQCARGRSRARIPSVDPSRDRPGRLDTRVVEELRVDDEDRTVRIKIPSNPRGFR
jgi:hypothetical protein